MKKIYNLIFVSALIVAGHKTALAQKDNVGIGTVKPDQSAILDVQSTQKGLLIPRMSLTQRNNIQNPADGLMIYQTDVLSGFYYYSETKKEWAPLSDATAAKSVAGTDGDWTLIGNSGTTPGTNFIGTTDNVSLSFKVNSQPSGFLGIGTNGNTFLGYQSGYYASSTMTGTTNTGVGKSALILNTAGNDNVAVGANNLFQNTIGNGNIAFGSSALTNNVDGHYNVAIGTQPLSANISGQYNVAIGYRALYTNTASYNFALGNSALLANTTGQFNSAYGDAALSKNTTGAYNFAAGWHAAFNNISGDNNLAIGKEALNNNSVGADNTAIGNEAGYSSLGSNNVFLGKQAGYSATGNNKLYISNTSTATPLVYGEFDNKNIKFHIGTTGKVVIGDDFSLTTSTGANSTPTGYRLYVKDGILTEKIKVALSSSTSDWSDYVFDENYKKMSLEEVEKYINSNKHLPNVPSTAEMMESGNDLLKTDAKLLEKIEELTLYMIELNKEVKSLKNENIELKKIVNKK